MGGELPRLDQLARRRERRRDGSASATLEAAIGKDMQPDENSTEALFSTIFVALKTAPRHAKRCYAAKYPADSDKGAERLVSHILEALAPYDVRSNARPSTDAAHVARPLSIHSRNGTSE